MRRVLMLAIVSLLFTGCDSSTKPDAGPSSSAGQGSTSTTPPGETEPVGQGSGTTEAEPAASEEAPSGDSVDITPENTSIVFVGLHSDKEKPDPRTCQFNAFAGKLMHADGKVTGIEVEIETDSISSEMEKLTAHLKSPDFFGVKENPTASFKTTSIEAGEEGKSTVTGDLTFLGTTKAISFPATVSVEEGKVKFDAEFDIDRTDFGMDYGLDKIEKAVAMTISIEA